MQALSSLVVTRSFEFVARLADSDFVQRSMPLPQTIAAEQKNREENLNPLKLHELIREGKCGS